MTIKELTEQIKSEKLCGFRYQQDGHHHFRDRFTVYDDGRMLFERFCYGEAAGLVYNAWANGADDNGVIDWDKKSFYEGFLEKLPKKITVMTAQNWTVDESIFKWSLVDKLKSDKANGYGALRRIFKRK